MINNLRRLSISKRLMLSTLIFSLCFILYGAFSFKTLNELKISGQFYELIVDKKDAMADILPPPGYLIEAYLVSNQLTLLDSQDNKNKLKQKMASLKKDYEDTYKKWSSKKAEFTPELQDMLLNKAYNSGEEFFKIVDGELIPAADANNMVLIRASVYKIDQVFKTHTESILKSVALLKKMSDEEEVAGKLKVANAIEVMFIFLAVSFSICVLLTLIISKSIYKPILESMKIARKVSQNDLTSDIDVSFKDEPGYLMQSLKEMNDNLLNVVSNMQNAATTIANSSSEISAGNMDLSTRTENQASSLQETASAIEELTSTIKNNSENTQEVNSLVHKASNQAQESGEIVVNVKEAMKEIQANSSKITDIISVIESIVFQTNILALNASVEAAHAGERGRGFAIVASEVKQLATKSGDAAKEIKKLIEASQTSIQKGNTLVHNATHAMDEVVASIKDISIKIQDIAIASKEQSIGISEINNSIVKMDDITQQNAAMVEEIATSSESLKEQALLLEKQTSIFKL